MDVDWIVKNPMHGHP